MEELEVEVEIPVRFKICFNDSINTDTVNELVEKMYSYQHVDLYFTTEGGALHAMNVLTDAVQEHPDIRVYLCEYIASAGTFFMTDVDKEVILHDNLSWIMFHGADSGRTNSFLKTGIDYKILDKQLVEFNKVQAEKFRKLGLTNQEIKRYMRGEDVYLYRKDFDRLKIGKADNP